jgi:hypothetical protein
VQHRENNPEKVLIIIPTTLPNKRRKKAIKREGRSETPNKKPQRNENNQIMKHSGHKKRQSFCYSPIKKLLKILVKQLICKALNYFVGLPDVFLATSRIPPIGVKIAVGKF